MGEISKLFPQRTNSRQNNSIKGDMLVAINSKEVFIWDIFAHSCICLSPLGPVQPQLSVCFLGFPPSFESGKRYENQQQRQGGRLAEGDPRHAVQPLWAARSVGLWPTGRALGRLAAPEADNAPVSQMPRHSWPELVFVHLEQAVMMKILSASAWVIGCWEIESQE